LPEANRKTRYNNYPRDISKCLPWQCTEPTFAYIDECYAVPSVGDASTVSFAEWDAISVLQPEEQPATGSTGSTDLYSLLGDWHDHESAELNRDSTSVSGIDSYCTETQLKAGGFSVHDASSG
jgi:hypothetical protein